jgi:hypothetical protein
MTYAKHVALAMQPFYQHQLGQQMRSAAASIPQQATAAAAPLSISLVARHCAHTEQCRHFKKKGKKKAVLDWYGNTSDALGDLLECHLCNVAHSPSNFSRSQILRPFSVRSPLFKLELF